MAELMNRPILICLLTFVALWGASRLGAAQRKKQGPMSDEEREDFGMIVAATLTLLGLIIGFTFSMATGRYDQRKNLEEAEANAIGTEYLRANLLPAANATNVRILLTSYLDQRILFYETTDDRQLQQIDANTARMQADLWAAVKVPGMK